MREKFSSILCVRQNNLLIIHFCIEKIKQQHRRKYKGKVDYILRNYISKFRTVCSINSIYYKNFSFADND
jgi:hypothetical protein